MSPRSIFIDTGAFLALTDPRDDLHAEAARFYRSLAPRVRRVTSWGVVAEGYTWLRYHLPGDQAHRWLARIEQSQAQGSLEIIFPDRDLDRRARLLLVRFDDQRLSYVDGHTLALLQSRPDIDAVFAFDQHLALSGLPLVPTIPRS
jgi:predicted nucleic acid-binding protein